MCVAYSVFDLIKYPGVYMHMSVAIQAGREGREKFGHRDHRQNPHASTTNKEKKKNKAFMMVRDKLRKQKGKRSYSDKVVSEEECNVGVSRKFIGNDQFYRKVTRTGFKLTA